jgi:hypothetical protein
MNQNTAIVKGTTKMMIIDMKNEIKKILRKHLLNEGKQVGKIYHFTDLFSAIGILFDDTMRVHTEGFKYSKEEFRGVSMTRNKDFWHMKDVAITAAPSVRLTFDGDKISNNFKVKPFNAFPSKTRNHIAGVEFEEIVIVDEGKEFKPKQFLMSIETDFSIQFDYLPKLSKDNAVVPVLLILNRMIQLKNLATQNNIPFSALLPDVIKNADRFKEKVAEIL